MMDSSDETEGFYERGPVLQCWEVHIHKAAIDIPLNDLLFLYKIMKFFYNKNKGQNKSKK